MFFRVVFVFWGFDLVDRCVKFFVVSYFVIDYIFVRFIDMFFLVKVSIILSFVFWC